MEKVFEGDGIAAQTVESVDLKSWGSRIHCYDFYAQAQLLTKLVIPS